MEDPFRNSGHKYIISVCIQIQLQVIICNTNVGLMSLLGKKLQKNLQMLRTSNGMHMLPHKIILINYSIIQLDRVVLLAYDKSVVPLSAYCPIANHLVLLITTNGTVYQWKKTQIWNAKHTSTARKLLIL